MKIEQAMMAFNVEDTKEHKAEGDGTNIGEFSGHLAAFSKDRGDDVFLPGAFRESISELQSKGRPIRMLRQHDSFNLIGGFPISQVAEDSKGLFVVGNINLDVQSGREAFSLMKQGVLTDMSIGFSINGEGGQEIRDGVRFLKSVTIWEGSLVTEPMNPDADVQNVKEFSVDEVKEWTQRDFEKFLKSTGKISNTAAKLLAGGKLAELKDYIADDPRKGHLIKEICDNLAGIRSRIAGL